MAHEPAQMTRLLKDFFEKCLPPWPELSPRARARIEAEIRARWPYYQRSQEYRRLAEEQARLIQRLAKVMPSPQPPTDKKAAAEVEEDLKRITESALQQYGMICFIDPHFSTGAILKSEILCRFFCPGIGRAAWSLATELPPMAGSAETEEDYLVKHRFLPVELCLDAPKQEILAAVEEVIDAWQDHWKKAGLPYGERYRHADTVLFPAYVKAVELQEQGKTLKEIRDRLFPHEDPVAAERKTALYVQNGNLLIRGQSWQIGLR